MKRTLLLAAALLLALGACARIIPTEQRATAGPTAEEIFTAKMVLTTGRGPNLDERAQWETQIDKQISTYLADHPVAANALDVQTFSFYRQVVIGMSKEQVTVLLGPPVLSTKEPAKIEELARKYWEGIKAGEPTEVWLYPQGWRLFFKDTRVVDITQYLDR